MIKAGKLKYVPTINHKFVIAAVYFTKYNTKTLLQVTFVWKLFVYNFLLQG